MTVIANERVSAVPHDALAGAARGEVGELASKVAAADQPFGHFSSAEAVTSAGSHACPEQMRRPGYRFADPGYSLSIIRVGLAVCRLRPACPQLQTRRCTWITDAMRQAATSRTNE
jgi:hypothetical protein